MVILYKCSISVNTETKVAIQTQITLQPNCMELMHVDATKYDLTERYMFMFPTVDICRSRWPGSGQTLEMYAEVARWRNCCIHCCSYLKCRFCLTTMSNITIELKSGAVV